MRGKVGRVGKFNLSMGQAALGAQINLAQIGEQLHWHLHCRPKLPCRLESAGEIATVKGIEAHILAGEAASWGIALARRVILCAGYAAVADHRCV